MLRTSARRLAHSLPSLPYAASALEPFISRETLNYHHGKHHNAYVTKLNQLIEGDSSLAHRSLEELIKTKDGIVFNQAAQIWNHTFYWNSLSPTGGGAPTGAIASKIAADFGGFDNFKQRFSEASLGHFGSGWTWLVLDPKDDKLKIVSGHDAVNPMKDGSGEAILTCDLWEHAYYVDYRNDRPKYVEAWWNRVNWDFASQNLSLAK
eukprot:GHVU01025195.1.p1 GENE.GHVU01025195.1~~GHVU01025195.1.p1  ORF type:complete len:207 (+),score=33.07 GHVU01025195.1:111-731(+)